MKLSRPSDTYDDLILALAVKEMNDTLGPEGYVPSTLVLGEYPKVFTKSEVPTPRSKATCRAKMIDIARKEVSEHMTKLRVERVLKHSFPPAADRPFAPGDAVLVWRQEIVNSRIGEWLGPFEVLAFDAEKKLVYIQERKISNSRPFNITPVKRYHRPEEIALSLLGDIADAFKGQRSPADEEIVLLTDIIHENDPWASGKVMTAAMKKGVRGLLQRGTFKVIIREEVPPDGNVLPGRFVLAIKSTDDGEIKY